MRFLSSYESQYKRSAKKYIRRRSSIKDRDPKDYTESELNKIKELDIKKYNDIISKLNNSKT